MDKLSSIAYYVTDKISSNDISLSEYVTTDCILQNKKGREIAINLPPQTCSLIHYQCGDVLVANIRPYLKKVWFADNDGGASSDVLVFRAKEGHSPNFLYALLLQDSFFDYVMKGAKGSKMPRGDKDQILRYEIPTLSCSEESIGSYFLNIDKKIRLNEQINQNLEAMAKQLYDYWFVQFDFPDENGRPYKSSGGKMVWNDQLKREIPIDWHCGNLFEIAVFTNGLACQKFRPKDDEAPLPVIKIREMHDGISADTEEVTPNIPESVKVYNGDVLFSWSASLEVVLWAYGLGGLNQHIFKVTSANDFPKSFYYFQLLDYVDVFKKMAEARKTTMGHITQDHLQQSTIAIPDNKDIADRFEELISPIFRQIIKSQEEILNLTKQRNELLPLLMNGQVSVNSNLYHNQLLQYIQGSKVSSISKKSLNQTIIRYPKEEINQQKIASYFEALDSQIVAITKKLESLKHIKAASLQSMFPQEGETTPKVRFKEFKGEWDSPTIDYVFELRNGYTPSKAIKEYWENGTIPWFRMEDIRAKGNILSEAFQNITPRAVKGSGLFKPNSIILATTATIGVHAMLIADSLANQQFTNFTIRKSLCDKYIPDFVNYAFYKIDSWSEKNTNSGGLLSVDIHSLIKQPFLTPSIEEQQKIASYFTNLDHQINLQSKRLEKLKQIKAACLDKMFV